MAKQKDKAPFLKGRVVKDLPEDPVAQNQLANEMLEWVVDEHVYQLEAFPTSKDYAPTWFYRLAERNEYFAQALDIARWTIAQRIQEDWRTGKHSKEYAMRVLALYNKDYREMLNEKLQAGATGKEIAKLVVLEKLTPAQAKDAVKNTPKPARTRKNEPIDV